MADAAVAGGETAHSPVLRDHGYHVLSVRDVVRETHDAASFVLDVPDELAETFAYRPGQFCTFRVRIGADEHLRSYSMSSAPETDAALAVTVKRVPGGLVSNWFNDNVVTGAAVEATRPAGVFCPGDTDRPLVAFCGGSGVTPVMSITKSVLATSGRAVRLMYANRDRGSVIFGDDLEALKSVHGDRLELGLHFDADRGFLERGDLAAFAETTPDADFYLCGPVAFMDLVEAALGQVGIAEDRIFVERFATGDEQPGDDETPGLGDAGDTATPDSVTIILGGKTSVVEYHPGDTLLDTARRGGLRPPFSCEAGNCATCMAFLKEGSVKMRANNALSADEVEEGWVLTCQSLPTASDITVEYEAM
jgi:3-ketosteroid 9alpha-monooxygenase subunit B